MKRVLIIDDEERILALMKRFLDRLGYEVTYSNIYPESLRGFDAVFSSHGNRGENWSFGTKITEEHTLLFQDYLEDGGNLYVEYSRMFARMAYEGYSNYAQLKQLFGVRFKNKNNNFGG